MSPMAESKTSDKTASDVVFSVPIKVAVKRDAGTGDDRQHAVEFVTASDENVRSMHVYGVLAGDLADRLELALDYVLEVRRA
jgi:hypothetical protein